MLKLGYNEATCKENSSVEKDLELCEKYGYDYIELRLDMLKEYFKTHTIDDLKAFFAKSHLKPFAFNSIENINFCTPEAVSYTHLDVYKRQNDLLRIVKVHHVARRHLDNAELHPHHLRVLDRGDHLVIALLKRAFARVFHGFFAPFSQFCVAESRPLCTGGCA